MENQFQLQKYQVDGIGYISPARVECILQSLSYEEVEKLVERVRWSQAIKRPEDWTNVSDKEKTEPRDATTSEKLYLKLSHMS